MTRALALATLLVTTRAWGFGAGVFGYSGLTPGMNCNGCHSGGTAPMSVTITGPATLQPGAQAIYTLDVVTGASSACAGFDIGASDGTLGVIANQPNQSYLNSGEITHNKSWPTGATVQLQFTFTAPAAPEMVTLHAWGLRSDCTDDVGGDSGAGGKLAVDIVAPPPPPPDLAGVDLLGVDLLGVDFAEPELSDLASDVDAVSGATTVAAQPKPDLGPPRNEPTWACDCRMGGRAPVHASTAVLALVFALVFVCVRLKS